MPDQRQYIAALTGMRGFAALMVFLFHYEALHPGIRLDLAVPVIGRILQFPLGFGGAGVDIFFVLSGFLLTLPFAGAALERTTAPDVSRYFKRRFLRVFPAYYAQLFIILALGGWFVTWTPQTAPDLAAHLVMFFNIGAQPVTPLVGVWWTLPVEMGFYLLLPLLAPMLRPSRWIPVLLAGLAISLLYRGWAAAHFGNLGSAQVFLAASQLPGSLAEFLLGASAALLVQWLPGTEWSRPADWILDLFFIMGLVVPAVWLWHVVLGAGTGYWMGHWGMIVAPVALGLPLSIAVLGLYWGSRVGTLLLANRVVYYLGLISYSLYLWHFVVMQQIQFLLGDTYSGLGHWVTFPLNTAAVIAVASLSYYLVERPFYRLKSYSQVKAD
ncbi:acyltransferase family protein [Pseudomonadota bacterium]